MATKRDVELGLQVTTAGSEGIRRLKDEVDSLAQAGGAAAPEFQQLSQVLDSLAQQATALEAFDAVSADVKALAQAQDEARAAAATLATQLDQLRQRTDGLRQAEQEALTTLRASQQALGEKRDALALLKANTDAANRSESAYKQEVRDLTLAIINLRSQIRDQAGEYRERSAAVSASAKEEKALAKELDASTRSAQKASAALSERDRALSDATQNLRALGVESDQLFAAERRLVESFVDVREELERLEAAQDRAIQQARQQADADEQRAFDAKANAAAYVNFWTQALNEREAAEQRTLDTQRRAADEAKRSAEAIQQAFGTVGVRSVRELEGEIANVRASLELLRTSGTVSGSALQEATLSANRRIKELERSIREATGQMTLLDRASRAFQTTFGQTAGGFIVAEGFQRLVQAVGDAGRAFVDANKRLESLRLGLGTIYQSTEIAERQLQLLRDTANKAGVGFDSISDSFLRLSASFQGANIPLSQTNALFESVTVAAGRLGLSSDRTNRVLDALGQIAAKGVVSMEELRQQLGDSLPGALSVAARGLGLTEAQLIKLVESGELLARDFIPAFTQALGTLQGDVNTLQATFARFQNVVAQVFQALGDAGGIDILRGALQGLGIVLGGLGVLLVGFTEGVFGSVRAAAAFTGTLTGGGGLTAAIAAANEELTKSNQRFQQTAEAYARYAGLLDNTKNSQDQQVSSSVAMRVAYTEVTKALEANTAVAKAAVDVAREQSGLATQLADALGTEAEQLEAKAHAAVQNEAALRNLLQTEQTNLAVLIAKRDALIASNEQEQAAQKAAGATAEQLKKLKEDQDREIKALQDKIDLQTQVVAKADAQAQAAQTSAAAARVEAEALRENNERIGELTRNYQAAQAEVDRLSGLKAAGAKVDAELTTAQTNLAASAKLYRDALSDQVKVLEAKNAASQADAQIVQAGFSVRLAQLQSLEATAKAIGDENLATYAKIETKRVEIQILQATVKAQIIEAEGSIAVAKAKLEEARASGTLTKSKEIELNTSIKIAQAKILEAKARGEGVGILEREITALRNGTNAKNSNANAANSAKNAVSGEAASRLENASAIGEENAALAEQKRLKVDAEGFSTGKDGQRLVQGSDLATRTGILNFLKQAGVDEENARRITEEFADAQGNITYSNNPGQLKYGGEGSTISQALLKAAETVTFGDRSYSNTPSGAALNGKTAQAPAAAPAPAPTNTTRTIRVELGGGNTSTINVASESDATALENLISQLVSAKGRVT